MVEEVRHHLAEERRLPRGVEASLGHAADPGVAAAPRRAVVSLTAVGRSAVRRAARVAPPVQAIARQRVRWRGERRRRGRGSFFASVQLQLVSPLLTNPQFVTVSQNVRALPFLQRRLQQPQQASVACGVFKSQRSVTGRREADGGGRVGDERK